MDRKIIAEAWLMQGEICLMCNRKNLCTIEDAFSEFARTLGLTLVVLPDGQGWKPKVRLSRIVKSKEVE